MGRDRAFGVRAAITGAVVLLVAGALALSRYRWDFAPAWQSRALFLEGLLMTLGVTAGGFLIGLAAGIAVALARLSRSLPVRHLGDLYVELIRGMPFIVQLTIAYWGFAPLVGLDNKYVVGIAALGLFAAAYIAEIFRAGIESVERGQVEAARSLGLTRKSALRFVILPQATKRMIPPLTGELIALTKESSLLFYIGVVELMSVSRQTGIRTYATFEAYLVVALFYLCVTFPLSLLARRLERRLGQAAPLPEHL